MAGVGTGGTITGCGMYFKEKNPNIKIIGVDCEGSILTHFFKTGEMIEAKPYVLEGIGEDFVPENYDFKVIDDFVMVGDKESFLMTRRLLKGDGIYAGGSAGAAICGALKYAKTLDKPKKILILLHDSGNRYASKIYNDDWMSSNGYFESDFNVQIKDVLKALGRQANTLITIEDKATIGQAIKLMEEKGISQLPIMSNGKVQGITSENDLMKPVFLGEYSLNDSISLMVKNTFKEIDENELLSHVADNLLKKHSVLVTRNGKVSNILTHIDILQYVAQRENA